MKTWEIELQKAKSTCIGCKKCMSNCPMLKNYCQNPLELLKRLEDGEIINDAAYSCCQCGYCDAVCPTETSLMSVFKTLKEEIQSQKNFFALDKGDLVVGFHQGNSFSPLFTGGTKGKSKKIFFPGCSLLGYSEKLVEKTYNHMKTLDSQMGILIHCCANPTLTMGKEKAFENRFDKTKEVLKEKGVEEIIVACANCYEIFQKYTENIKITSLWEWLDENGLPENIVNNFPKEKTKEHIKFALHDPCPTRKRSEVHEAVRKLLVEMNIEFEEFEKNRDQTLCCGAGAMVGVMKPEIAKNQNIKRANQTENEYIVTYCESCVESMISGGKSSVHLLDLIFDREEIAKQKYTQIITATPKKWVNRRKGSQNLK